MGVKEHTQMMNNFMNQYNGSLGGQGQSQFSNYNDRDQTLNQQTIGSK